MDVHYLAVFAPLIGFLAAGLLGKRFGDYFSQVVTSASVILAAILSVELFFTVVLGQTPVTLPVMAWISSGDFHVEWALRFDQLSVVMMCVVNIVSACVHVYSIGYMAHDPSKSRFMAYLSLFTFAMLMLVTSDNLLQLFFGWEGVGLASYLLIGFWFHKKTANAAAVKAFIVNRVGDVGLILGILTIFVVFGTVQYDEIFAEAPAKADVVLSYGGIHVHALTFACLLLFIGAVGKSAQLGLHTWLPDAMEGPTPVSALIHAATMVTAGVFLIARFSPVFEYAPTALAVVCFVGAITALVAATIGMTQFDIKRVIAYSTMSQLGYMFFALGVSAYSAAMFHLVTHAFFKALLFLGAGSVIHALSDEQDMRKMGGVWKMIPFTYIMMWVGSLALAGVPIFAGFYSKDLILEAAWANGTWYGHFAYWIGVAAAVMTAFYSWRLLLMTFHGKPKASKETMDHIHESPAVMLVPLAVLAIGAVFSGAFFYHAFSGVPEAAVHGGAHLSTAEGAEGTPMLDKAAFFGKSIFVLPENDTVAAAHHVVDWVKHLPIFAAVAGILLAWVAYIRYPALPSMMAWTFRPVYLLFYRKWFFDEIYQKVFVRSAFATGDKLWTVGDQKIIDGVGANGIASTSRRIGAVLSKIQNGFVYQYAFFMIFGLIALVSWIAYVTGIIRFE